MVVKAAYFDSFGYDPDREIRAADLLTARSFAPTFGVTFGNLHDVAAWGRLLVETRGAVAGLAYPNPTFGGVVIAQCERVYGVWRETLRYHQNRPYPHEVDRVCGAVEWLLDHANEL